MLLNVADRLRRRGFDELQFLNLGGGLGIHYERHVRVTYCLQRVLLSGGLE